MPNPPFLKEEFGSYRAHPDARRNGSRVECKKDRRAHQSRLHASVPALFAFRRFSIPGIFRPTTRRTSLTLPRRFPVRQRRFFQSSPGSSNLSSSFPSSKFPAGGFSIPPLLSMRMELFWVRIEKFTFRTILSSTSRVILSRAIWATRYSRRDT